MALTTRRPAGRSTLGAARRDPSAPWRHIDGILLLCTLCVAGIGVLMVYSATRGSAPPYDHGPAVRQGAFAVGGAVAMVVASLVDYRALRAWAWAPYVACIAALVAVLTPLGLYVNGAQRWIDLGPFQLQPSEFTKLAIIVALSAMLASWNGEVGPRQLVVVAVALGVPAALVLQQPDLGTVLAFLAITIALLVVGGVRARVLFLMGVVAIAGAVLVLTSDTLEDYQAARLTSFIDPEADVQASFNQRQAVIAVASGSLMGQGFGDGQQTQHGFVPEHETDFIFVVVAEELGFVGGAVLLVLYSVICWRVWRCAHLARDLFGSLLCVGVLVMFAFQIFTNVGMATQIMPVTGIPLPLVSYGGSSMLTMFLAIGVVLNVHMRRFR
ncbi:MAG: rod shape-determining protein RodA [Acidimicrobiia bacterium]|nr:rod shape-determining protein RodA [Acidimicrobiia bacterium]